MSDKRRKELAPGWGESRAAREGQNRRVMAMAVRYFYLVREIKWAYNHRLRLVESARRDGECCMPFVFPCEVLYHEVSKIAVIPMLIESENYPR